MSTFEEYKLGLKILTPEPIGNGGQTLNENFMTTADLIESAQDLIDEVEESLGTMALQDANDVSITGGSIATTGTVSVPGGTASSPSFTFTNDTDTGLYLFGVNALGITCNGTHVANFNASAEIFSFEPGWTLTVDIVATTGIRRIGDPLNIQNVNFSHADTAVRLGQGIWTNSSGAANPFAITPTYNQSGTAGSTDLLINRTESMVGSGVHKFLDLQQSGTSISYIDRFGAIFGMGYAFANDIDTGIARSSENNLSVVVGGVGVAIFNSNGLSVPSLAITTGTTSSTFGNFRTIRHADGDNNTLIFQSRSFTVADNSVEAITGTFSNSTGLVQGLVIQPTINQSSTASFTDLRINRTETAIGSGERNFIHCSTNAGDFLKVGTTTNGHGITLRQSPGNSNGVAFRVIGANALQLRNLADNDSGNFSAALITSRRYNTSIANLTDAATIAWNHNIGQIATLTAINNRTMGTPTNMANGSYCTLIVTQDGTGGRTLGFSSSYKFPNGNVPNLTPTPGAVDIFTFYCDGTNLYGLMQENFH